MAEMSEKDEMLRVSRMMQEALRSYNEAIAAMDQLIAQRPLNLEPDIRTLEQRRMDAFNRAINPYAT